MRAYAALAAGREVVLDVQSGCGRSAAPADLSGYSLARYVTQLEGLRAHLRLERMIVLGHSWGGMLAPAYTDAHPDRISAVVLAGSAPTWADFAAASRLWLAELGPAAVATAARGPHAPRYDALTDRYYARHLCRLAAPPPWLAAEGAMVSRNPVYVHRNGPTEFDFSGALASLDGRVALRSLRVRRWSPAASSTKSRRGSRARSSLWFRGPS